MHITTGTMTSVLDTLERNGHIKRIADPNDRRRVLVDITPDAQAVLDKMLPEVQHVVAAALANIDDDTLQALLDALAAIGAAITTIPDTLPPPLRDEHQHTCAAPNRRQGISDNGPGVPCIGNTAYTATVWRLRSGSPTISSPGLR